MKGRKPTPTEIREREGNPRKHPLPQPILVGGRVDKASLLEPPEDLDETAKAFWRQAIPVLAEVGILDVVDSAALEMLATQYARAKQAGKVIREQGHLARGSQGQLVEHPSLATERAAATAFLRFAEQYALTPVARTRLGLAEIQRRSLQAEMAEDLGPAKLERV